MADLKYFGINAGEGNYHEEIIYSLALIYNSVNAAVEAYLVDHGLNSSKFNILLVVKHQGKEDGISQIEISKRLVVTRSNMTKMVDKLEKEGLVTRAALEGDRRVNIVRITQTGSELLDRVWPGYVQVLKNIIEPLPVEQKKILAANLVSWVERI
jgi:MarR family 2-MHQ and catechol resistance regulon transcriptional repressor